MHGDQLSPIGPIMLALTAATPVYKGFLANTDVRWNQISRAVDCRTPEELGEKVSTPTLVEVKVDRKREKERAVEGAEAKASCGCK